MKNLFKDVAVSESNSNYDIFSSREKEIYGNDDIRSPFARDYTRIIHSTAYRRLKHKTQVFYNIENDHICTRMEHVSHVESVSYTIAKYLGLNDELTKAIATGHDLGHAPFGHEGELILDTLYQKYLNTTFWHERNGLYMVDNIELLPNHKNEYMNLNLTYAVRDGIIAHCGEINDFAFKPRSDFDDLYTYKKGFAPCTYEGCVVKLSDKIAYLGRDIEDAISLGFLSENSLNELSKTLKIGNDNVINTTSIIGNMIVDVCNNSTPDKGIAMSEDMGYILNEIKKFNYKYIYKNEKFLPFKKYASLIINELFEQLLSLYNDDVMENLNKNKGKFKSLIIEFIDFISKYSTNSDVYKNKKIYADINDKKVYIKAILDYIAGMTDKYAVNMFNEVVTF